MKIVIKIGSGSITANTAKNLNQINQRLIDEIVELTVALKKEKHQVIIVSSGAISLGSQKMGLSERPATILDKQVAASVGQTSLVQAYQDQFAKYQQLIGQVLLTRSGMQDKEKFFNARSTLLKLLEADVIPLVNENDTVADEELKFSDNDLLSAVVAELVFAQKLFILTDTKGLYTQDPRFNKDAKLISIIKEINSEVEAIASSKPSHWGTGGMSSKIEAAKIATSFGTSVHILSSESIAKIPELAKHKEHSEFLSFLEQKKTPKEKAEYGTIFLAKAKTNDYQKAWLASSVETKGCLTIQEKGLQFIIQEKGLLAEYITDVKGDFARGSALEIMLEAKNKSKIESKNLVAKGIIKYSSRDLRKIQGRQTNEIAGILGYYYGKFVINPADLAIFVEDLKDYLRD